MSQGVEELQERIKELESRIAQLERENDEQNELIEQLEDDNGVKEAELRELRGQAPEEPEDEDEV